MKRITVFAAVLLFLLPLAAGCSGAKLPDFGMTAKQIMQGAVDVGGKLGYSLKVTSYEANTQTDAGVKTTDYSYTINDYLYLVIESSSAYGDSISIGLDDTAFDSGYSADPTSEWVALVYGVMSTIDPSADYDEFDELFSAADVISYHGYTYTYSEYNAVYYVIITAE
ncbi:MAG: hypothetical protein ACC608_06540 [Anaerofustis sp.]